MKFEAVVHGLPEAIFREFENALSRGVWSNGMPITSMQRQICQKALRIRLTPPPVLAS